jgi:hypothetical protein
MGSRGMDRGVQITNRIDRILDLGIDGVTVAHVSHAWDDIFVADLRMRRSNISVEPSSVGVCQWHTGA